MRDFIRLCVTNPAKSVGKQRGEIKVGEKNFLLFDTEKSLHVSNLHSLYHGEELYGVIKNLDEL